MIKSITWNHDTQTVTIESDQAFIGTEIQMLEYLRDEIDANIKRRDRLVDAARAEIQHAVGAICRKYGVDLEVEVTG